MRSGDALEAGIQLHLPTYNSQSLADLVRLGQAACAGGVAQLWATDNLGSRDVFLVLGALAANVPVRLGTAVLVQYFRGPVAVADAAATLTELLDGRELVLGISRGNRNTDRLVRTPKPVSMLRETAQSLKRLLAGETVHFRDYPAVAAYFNLVPERPYRLSFAPRSQPALYGGGNAALSLEVAGAHMDGIVWGWTFLAAARSGRLSDLLRIAKDAARAAGRLTSLPRVAEIKLYVGRDHAAMRRECRLALAGRVLALPALGYTAEDFERLGFDLADVERLRQAAARGASRAELADLMSEPMLDSLFVAGDVAFCREQLADVCRLARAYGFRQLMFSELGTDPEESTRLLCEELLPVLG